jgi:hypothetical protein
MKLLNQIFEIKNSSDSILEIMKIKWKTRKKLKSTRFWYEVYLCSWAMDCLNHQGRIEGQAKAVRDVCLVYCSVLKMEQVHSSEVYVNFTCLHDVTSKDSILHRHHHHHHWQNSPIWAIALFRRFCQNRQLDRPVFTSLDFATIIFLHSKVIGLVSNSPNLEDQVSVFTSPSDRVAQLYPQALDSLFVAFYDSQGYGGGFLTRFHMGSSS